MLDKLNEIEKAALESLSSITDQSALDAWRVANVGRSSPLMQVFAGFGKLSKEEKPAVGAVANRVKVALESALEERTRAVKNAALAKSLEEMLSYFVSFPSDDKKSISYETRFHLSLYNEMIIQAAGTISEADLKSMQKKLRWYAGELG